MTAVVSKISTNNSSCWCIYSSTSSDTLPNFVVDFGRISIHITVLLYNNLTFLVTVMSNTETLNKKRKLSAAELAAALQHITNSDEEDLIDSDDDESSEDELEGDDEDSDNTVDYDVGVDDDEQDHD